MIPRLRWSSAVGTLAPKIFEQDLLTRERDRLDAAFAAMCMLPALSPVTFVFSISSAGFLIGMSSAESRVDRVGRKPSVTLPTPSKARLPHLTALSLRRTGS